MIKHDEHALWADSALTINQRLSAIIYSQRTAVKVSLISALTALLCLIALLVVGLMNRPQSVYFATTTDGRLFSLTPLSQPIISGESVSAFTSRILSTTFTFDYINYARSLAQVADAYTPDALTLIKTNLEKKGGVVSEAIANKWIVTASLLAAPQLIHQGLVPNLNVYGWRLRVPLLITFESEAKTTSARYWADVTVIRVDQRNHAQGVQIATLQLTTMN